jgi:hypothetical protein
MSLLDRQERHSEESAESMTHERWVQNQDADAAARGWAHAQTQGAAT